MKFKTWTCGFIAGTIGTIILTVISMTLYLVGIIPISITEYATRFILDIPDEPMNIGRWIVGFITNFGLGGVFGVFFAYVHKITGPEESKIKMLGLTFILWFFQLAIVPALDRNMAKFSTYDTAIAYYFIYLIWSIIVSSFIQKYLQFPDKDTAISK
ncbi:MAG: hypothetical protein APF76_04785 [Desulfitibacter sp. BRH_c19]|nr:MAG: hypothetical protein APF76_04785 [Desulfitibacter sp. BRH_c19]